MLKLSSFAGSKKQDFMLVSDKKVEMQQIYKSQSYN